MQMKINTVHACNMTVIEKNYLNNGYKNKIRIAFYCNSNKL